VKREAGAHGFHKELPFGSILFETAIVNYI